MEGEFNSLEAKVAQVATLCERLRAENTELRQHLAKAQGEARQLSEKVEGAKAKVEHLLTRLPE